MQRHSFCMLFEKAKPNLLHFIHSLYWFQLFVLIKSQWMKSVTTAQSVQTYPSAVQHRDIEGDTQQNRETVQDI